MIGCLRTRVRMQPTVALYFEFENELKFYNLEALSTSILSVFVQQKGFGESALLANAINTEISCTGPYNIACYLHGSYFHKTRSKHGLKYILHEK